MILVDLSISYEGWINDPNRSGIQILGIRSQDPFSGSTDISAVSVAPSVSVAPLVSVAPPVNVAPSA